MSIELKTCPFCGGRAVMKAVISNCRLGLRKKSTTELLFCMLRSGR